MAAEVDKTIVKTPEGEAARGRAGVLAKFMKANPEYQGEPTDEELWGYAGEDYDSVKGSHKKNMEDQAKFGEFLANNPRFGGIIGSSYGEGEDKVPVGKAIGRAYGDILQEDDDFWEGVKEYESSQAQSREEQEQAQNNFQESLKRFDQYVTDNQLPEERKAAIYEGLMQLAESFLMGDIPTEIFELIDKGQTSDQRVQEAADTGFVEGKGEVVRPALRKLTSDAHIPDMAGGTGAGKNKTRGKKQGGSYYDSMEEVKE